MTIVYCSKTGHTRQYAEMLAAAEKMKVYSLQEARSVLPEKEPVLFLGWLMAGHISGIDQVVRRWDVRCAVGVGMAPAGKEALATMAKANFVPHAPVFYLQGGWAPKKVGWFQRRAVGMVTRGTRKALLAKKDRTQQDEAYLSMLIRGGSFVEYQNLKPIQDWLAANG